MAILWKGCNQEYINLHNLTLIRKKSYIKLLNVKWSLISVAAILLDTKSSLFHLLNEE